MKEELIANEIVKRRIMMEGEYFSLLWDSEENYEEWRRDLEGGEDAYITDLNLRYVYEEICRLGRFGDQYDFEQVFLHPCPRRSTVCQRQRIMERLYGDPLLHETAEEIVACVSEYRKKTERICDTKDEMKKKIFYLQALYEYLLEMGKIYEKLAPLLPEETPLLNGIRILADRIAGGEAERQKECLRDYLSMLCQAVPDSLILNKDKEQVCRSVVMASEEASGGGYTDKLKKAAGFFLEDYDFSINVYQDMDITCLDKRIQEYFFRQLPQAEEETQRLYEEYKNFDFWPYIRLANELVFYLSCIRFRREYEQAGFYFVMPRWTEAEADCIIRAESGAKAASGMRAASGANMVCDVRAAYDMTLGINLFQEKKGALAVANDYEFGESGRLFILTGANQGGKTTFIRSIGLIQCLGQIGMFVPAREAALGLVKHIHTHFSRDDEKMAAVGRFEQELGRMRRILKNLQEGDMVLLNETFTSTQRSAAVILLKQLLAEFDRRHCVGGLVTHFYEIFDELPEGSFYSLAAGVSGDGVHKERTFRIMRMDSYRQSYARDIAVKCGVSYDQLLAAFGE